MSVHVYSAVQPATSEMIAHGTITNVVSRGHGTHQYNFSSTIDMFHLLNIILPISGWLSPHHSAYGF
jgi:hypothetical protein